MNDNRQPEEVQDMRVSTLIRNIGQLVTMAQEPMAGASGQLQIIENAAIAVRDGIIVWLGPDASVVPYFLHDGSSDADEITIVDVQGMVVTPGFVDSHTHLVFAGNRAEEFHLRRSGVSYGELLAQGRGILTTMNATRNADAQTLLASARTRLSSMQRYGTTTVEVKTGYGLNVDTEEICLRLMAELNIVNAMRVVPTFLGAHSVPPEYKHRRDEYVDLVVNEMLPRFAGLARFCDVFCEREAFTLPESRRILTRAKELGYKLKVHADQLSSSGGTQLAAELGAVSADHLDHATDADLDALRSCRVVLTHCGVHIRRRGVILSMALPLH